MRKMAAANADDGGTAAPISDVSGVVVESYGNSNAGVTGIPPSEGFP
jgi:hypothetical protein